MMSLCSGICYLWSLTTMYSFITKLSISVSESILIIFFTSKPSLVALEQIYRIYFSFEPLVIFSKSILYLYAPFQNLPVKKFTKYNTLWRWHQQCECGQCFTLEPKLRIDDIMSERKIPWCCGLFAQSLRERWCQQNFISRAIKFEEWWHHWVIRKILFI